MSKDAPKVDWFLKYIKKEYPNLKKRSIAKDTCNVCDDLTVSDEDRERHKQAANDAIALCKYDSKKPYTFIFDMMSTLSLPKLESNQAFYKRQLLFYVVGLHNDFHNEGFMYYWHEAQAGKGSREICNILYQHFLSLQLEKAILWCDSTVSQN